MDRVNADHFEFQKQGLWIEGISYFVAKEPFSLEYRPFVEKEKEA